MATNPGIEPVVSVETQGQRMKRLGVDYSELSAVGDAIFDSLCPGIRFTPEDDMQYTDAALDAIEAFIVSCPSQPPVTDGQSSGASVPDQALAVPAEPVARLGPTGFDPSRGVFISHELYAFLMGQGPVDGTWFNDLNDRLRGRFWWRALLRAAASGTEARSGGTACGSDPKDDGPARRETPNG